MGGTVMKKVLIVEDDQLIQSLLKKKLQEKGYYVSTAEDGEAGLQAIKETRPSLVLLDVVLPRLSGFEVVQEMKKLNLLEEVPVIIISNSGQPVEIETAKELGIKDLLLKTEFDPAE